MLRKAWKFHTLTISWRSTLVRCLNGRSLFVSDDESGAGQSSGNVGMRFGHAETGHF
jgi:hypothetical protein